MKSRYYPKQVNPKTKITCFKGIFKAIGFKKPSFRNCTAIGHLGLGLNRDCDTITILVKGVSDDQVSIVNCLSSISADRLVSVNTDVFVINKIKVVSQIHILPPLSFVDSRCSWV